MSLQFELSTTWKCALIGGFIPAAFTLVDVLRSVSNVTFQGLFLGGVVAGYLVKRHDGVGLPPGLEPGSLAAFQRSGRSKCCWSLSRRFRIRCGSESSASVWHW